MFQFYSTAKFDKEAAIILIDKEQLNHRKINVGDPKLKAEIDALVKSDKFNGDNEEIFPLVFKKGVVLLVGVGKKEDLSLTAFRITLRKALLSSFLKKVKTLEIVPHEATEKNVNAVIESVCLGTYKWKKYLTPEKNDHTADTKNIWIVSSAQKSYAEAIKICEGVNFARDLINDNADVVTSNFIENAIKNIVKGQKNISLEILNKKELKARGLNLHLAVNQGSPNEPKLIIAKYQSGTKSDNFIALIGKGITFDTGGLNLKPTGYIETMRTDMSGCAAVIGTLKNAIALGLKKNIIFAVGVAENVIGSGAYKPGDVIRGYSGKTVEIGNTDAEGRLVLADAMAYVVKNYKPKQIIDIATLTGACVVALGHDYSGLMSNDDALAEKLLRSAAETDDRIWRLPIYPEIKEHVKSKIADIKNTGLAKGAAGACTAGEFLRQFAGDTKWGHLDIAGTAFVDGSERMYFGYGATGAGVRLLTDFLRRS